MRPTKLYSRQHNSYCNWNGVAYENDGKVSGAYFYGIEKANNNGFLSLEQITDKVFDAVSYSFSRKKIENLEEKELIEMYNDLYKTH
jgi:hypothetical protein